MILTYSKYQFVAGIIFNRKIHTIRTDQTGRWRVGRQIQHWMGNPRNVQQNPFQFAEGQCMGIQRISIKNVFNDRHSVEINNRILSDDEVLVLAKNDGFDSIDEFWDFFKYEEFNGKIIHFTDFKY